MDNRKIDSKEVGLDVGLLLFKNFLDTDYLHYGLFNDNLDAKVINLPSAQVNYAEYLISIIPKEVKSILDVGCGSGRFANTLIERGFKVDCVSPESVLTDYAEELINSKGEIYKVAFQKFKSDNKYDLIIFSESFQYIPMKAALNNAIFHLNSKGYIIISDFFQIDAEGKSPLGGGHKFNKWKKLYSTFQIELKYSKDITKETAPTIDIANQLSQNLLHPIWKLILRGINQRFPRILKFLQWKYKEKIDKIDHTYFSGEMNGKSFLKYKRYMVYLFQKT